MYNNIRTHIDVDKKAGFFRSVDWIDFIMYILPTTVYEALQRQKRDVIRRQTASRTPILAEVSAEATDKACQALINLSRACRITEQYRISDNDLDVLQNLINNWQQYLIDNFKTNVFTINMHYLYHVCDAIRHLGPLRLVSARPMERMIGKMKDGIKSRQNPGANANTCVQKHFADVYKDKYATDIQSESGVTYAATMTVEEGISLVEKRSGCSAQDSNDLRQKFRNEEITVIKSYFPIRSGKTLTLAPRKETSVIFASSMSNSHAELLPRVAGELKYAKVLLMFRDEGSDCAVIDIIYPINYNEEQQCHYYNQNTCNNRMDVIRLSDVLSYGVEIDSIDDRNPGRVFVLWEPF